MRVARCTPPPPRKRPRRLASSLDGEDEVGTPPEVLDVGATELAVGRKCRKGLLPALAESAEVGVAGDGVG